MFAAMSTTNSTATGKLPLSRRWPIRPRTDAHLLHSMPLLLTKIEGKGNGIKTVIPNMADVARALSRPPSYPTKFFGCELGAQTSTDEKNERYIVNGAHDANRLRELLDAFIEKFVLCKSCKNPETELVIIKSGRVEDIIRDCKACGERTGVDMRHKLTTFIVKNPPVKSKKSKKSKAQENGKDDDENGDEEGDEGGESDDEMTKRIKAEAADLNTDTKLGKEDWSQDTSAEAVKQRIKALQGNMAGVSLGDDDGSDDDANSPYGQLGKWIEENRDTDDKKTFSISIFKKAEELGIEKRHKTVLYITQSLFTENFVAEIEGYAPLLVKVNLATCSSASYFMLNASTSDGHLREAPKGFVRRRRACLWSPAP